MVLTDLEVTYYRILQKAREGLPQLLQKRLKEVVAILNDLSQQVGDKTSIAAIDELMRALAGAAEETLTKTVRQIADSAFQAEILAGDALVTEAQIAGVSVGTFSVGVSFGKLDPLSVFAMIERSLKSGPLSARIWGTTNLIRGDLLNVFLRAQAQGLNGRTVARMLRSMLANSDYRIDDLRSDPMLGEALSKVTKIRGFGNIPGVADIDLRFVTNPDEREALRLLRDARRKAKTIRFFTERLAVTELNSANAEAGINASRQSPVTLGMKRSLSATHPAIMKLGDRCDPLTGFDWYGLGKGVFPKYREIGSTHPFDRCFNTSVLRDPKDWFKPLPAVSTPRYCEEFIGPSGGLIKAKEVQKANDIVQFFGQVS